MLNKDFLPCSDFNFAKAELTTNEIHYQISNILFSENKFGLKNRLEGLIIVKAISWVPVLLEDITIQNSD